MMKNRIKLGNRVIGLLLALMMLASSCALAESVSSIPERDRVFTDYGMGYHLKDFLGSGYNVIAFNNAHLNTHVVGALLVQNVYSGEASNSGFADGENLPPSYIKGRLEATNSRYNSRNKNNNAPLYVGSSNTVTVSGNNYAVNGLSAGNDGSGTSAIYVSDHFFNFNEAYRVVKADQQTMLSRSSGVVKPDRNGGVTVNVGENVTLESLDNVQYIDIVGNMEDAINVTINVTASGYVKMPEMRINGRQQAAQEQDASGTSIVWNFPNATTVVLPTLNWFGHVIAPDALVTQEWGNYNGTIICYNIFSSGEGHVHPYNAETTSWDVVFSLEKEWVDGNNADGVRPKEISVALLANGVRKETVTLSEADGWSYVWDDLPETDASGKKITYTVEELDVPNYTSSYDPKTQTLINTHVPETTSVSGTKTWAGDENIANSMRPRYITVNLYADNQKVDSKIVEVIGDSQTYTFDNLPKYKDGREIRYAIHEDYVPNYIGTTEGYNLINTWGVQPIEISGKKTWEDASNADGLRPASVTVELLADGEVIDYHIATAVDGWEYKFTNLSPKDENGEDIEYTIREVPVAGYETSYTQTEFGYDITNTHEPEKVSVKGKKTWNDDDNQDGVRPESITIILLADGGRVASKTVSAKDNWEWEFTDLQKRFGGSEIRYTVVEYPIPEGYSSQPSGMNVTNTHISETVDVSGSKTWVDANNQDGKRPQSITINLLADGKQIQSKMVTAADNWAWSFADLPKFSAGKEIVYTITEEPVAEYATQVDGYNVINTYEVETIELGGTKYWEDDNNRDGVRPQSVVIRLYKQLSETDQPTIVDTRTVTADAQGNWYGAFGKLPKYENGKEIIYTIAEDPVAGYSVTYDGFNITNTHETEKVSVSGSKIWNDADNQDGKRPQSITIRLLADGEDTGMSAVLRPDAQGNWGTYAFTDLVKYKNVDGTVSEIVYTVAEDEVKEYTTDYIPTADGFNIRNNYVSETIELQGTKVWDDNDNQDGMRPARVIIRLHANDLPEPVGQRTVTQEQGWSWTFPDLPKYYNGKEVRYYITEDAVPGYTTEITNRGNSYTVTNTHEPQNVYISGEKVWNDDNDEHEARPEQITITLYADGEKVDEAKVTSRNNWAFSFSDLPEYRNGHRIVYTIDEDLHEDYTVDIVRNNRTDEDGHEHYSYTVTNTFEPDDVHVGGTKRWIDNDNQDGIRPQKVTVHLWADGVEINAMDVYPDEQGNWAYNFTTDKNGDELHRYHFVDGVKGSEIVYTITEDPVEGYDTVITGHNMVNTHVPELVSVSGSKTWNDNDNQDGKRPVSIIIRLHKRLGPNAEPVEVKYALVTPARNWAWNFVDLPKYENGQEIIYSITEDPVPEYTSVIDGYNVTNTRTPETRSISGVKTWNDANNQDGLRPQSITINLLADGAPYKTQTVTAADGWEWTFADLPRYNAGKEIVYTTTEEAVDGYTSTVHGHSVTNTHIPQTVSVSGSKTWVDDNNRDGKRPEQILIALLADNEVKDYELITEEDNWTWNFTDLPKYKNVDGKAVEIVYTIYERPVEGYTAQTDGYHVTNTYEPEKVSVSGRKTWVDDNDRDGKRPQTVTVNLLANGAKIDSRTVGDAEGWAWKFENLNKYADGQEIVYTIEEEAVAEYTATVTGYNVTNTYVPEKVSVSGSKTWDDDNNRDRKRPGYIIVYLYADGVQAQYRYVSANQNWSWNFTDLPKHKNVNGEISEIVYTVHEDAVPGYTPSINGYNITNAYKPESTYVHGHKTWDDGDNRDGKRPQSITINLLANGVEVDSKTVTAADNWEWTFRDLPANSNGAPINYTIEEEPIGVEGYTSAVNGYNVTNTYVPETTDVSGVKTWNDDNDRDGKRPDSIVINLYANGQKVHSKTVTENDNWAWTFAGLPKNHNGSPITYRITEDVVSGYTTEVDGYNVTNTYTPEKTSISGLKGWNDANNQDGKRPQSITINLLANGEKIDSMVLTAENGWFGSFDHLPKYKDGVEIEYTVTEEPVEGYTVEYRGSNIINTYVPEKISVSGSKTWNDNGNQDGVRPSSIVIHLHADGVVADRKTVTEADGWAWTFSDLDKYAGGKEIEYTITEERVAGYTAQINGYNVTNTHVPEKTSVSGRKWWNDARDQDGKRPDSIVINLLANGAKVDSRTVTEADGWAWTFSDLDKYAGGSEIEYTITEEAVAEYSTRISGYNVVNSYTPGKTSVSGSKTWNDDENRDGLRPSSITINLLADGEVVDSRNVTEADGWAWTFDDLPVNSNGTPINYTITEEPVAGYTTEVSGYNVVNSYTPGKTSVSGSKTWIDGNNMDGIRPQNITIILLADGLPMDSRTVTEADGWAWTFDDLPVNSNGTPIVYTITEEPVEGYTAAVNGYNVINTLTEDTRDIDGRKIWNDHDNQDNKRPTSITVRLMADGVQVDSVEVTADSSGNWSWHFPDLPKLNDVGMPIVYTIEEDPVDGYVTEYSETGFDITNSYDTAITYVTVNKIWVDDNNKAGRRPQSVVINLLADGVKVASQVITAEDNWTYTFNGLDQFAAGRLIQYTVEEEKVEGYRSTIDGFDVINTFALADFAVTKRWMGRSVSTDIGLVLYANGVALDPQPAYQRNGDVYVWSDLQKMDEQGNEIIYSASEIPMDGFAVSYVNDEPYAQENGRVYNGGQIINTALSDIAVRKVWVGIDDHDPHPAIKLTLYCNGEVVQKPQPAPDKDGWYVYADLPTVVDGKDAVYTVVEEPVEGFVTAYVNANGETDAAYNGGTIYNSVLPQTGDHSSIAGYAAALMISFAGLVLLMKRRRNA